MTFTKRLRDGVRQGRITSSVRIWRSPRVTPGKRYRMEEGEIEVDSIEQIGFQEITPQLARESGFLRLSSRVHAYRRQSPEAGGVRPNTAIKRSQ